MTARPVTNFIRQTDNRQTQTDDRQTKFLLKFLCPRVPKRAEKKFQLNRKKNNFRDCRNICPPGLRTYNEKRFKLKKSKILKKPFAWLLSTSGIQVHTKFQMTRLISLAYRSLTNRTDINRPKLL